MEVRIKGVITVVQVWVSVRKTRKLFSPKNVGSKKPNSNLLPYKLLIYIWISFYWARVETFKQIKYSKWSGINSQFRKRSKNCRLFCLKTCHCWWRRTARCSGKLSMFPEFTRYDNTTGTSESRKHQIPGVCQLFLSFHSKFFCICLTNSRIMAK